MTRALILATVVWTVFESSGIAARADESAPVANPPAAPSPVAAGQITDDQIAELCGKLGAAEFSARELATKQLIAAGGAVIDRVAAAAESESLEVAVRCLLILRELYRRPEETTKSAAQAALLKLSASSHRSAARRAAEILNPPASAQTAVRQVLLRRVNGPAGGVGVAVIQVANLGGANAARRIQISNDNGNVRVTAEEGGRKVVITHKNETNIIVCITEPPAAGETAGKTTVHPAKDLAELKEKFPEAHRLFERYRGGTRPAARDVGALPVEPPKP